MKSKTLVLTTLFFWLFVTSCSEQSDDFNLDQNVEMRDGSQKLLTMTYTLDMVIMNSFRCEETPLDLAAASPSAEKQRVRLTIMQDGSIEIMIKHLDSQNAFTIPHETPPNPLPKVNKSKLKNGKLEFFDSDGNIIHSTNGQEIQMPYLANIADALIDALLNNEIDLNLFLSCMRSNVDPNLMLDYLNDPPDDVQIEQLNDQVYAVTMPVPADLMLPQAVSTINLIDISNNLLLGSRLYGENGDVVQCMMFRYDDCELKGFKQEIFQSLPNCNTSIMETVGEFSDINIQIH